MQHVVAALLCVLSIVCATASPEMPSSPSEAHSPLEVALSKMEDEDAEPEKRGWNERSGVGNEWNKLSGMWGKRAANWNNLSGMWGKRSGNWNNLSGMWGKRDWNNLSGMWGKRGWNELSGMWGKRGWNNLNNMWGKRGWNDLSGAWGKRNSHWNNLKGLWGKRSSQSPYSSWEDSVDEDIVPLKNDGMNHWVDQ